MTAPVMPDEQTDVADQRAVGATSAHARPTDAAQHVVGHAVTVVDRADSPVSLVTERFLRAVVAVVPLDLLEELHLFSPLRQGMTETGIAVVAAREVVAESNDRDTTVVGELALDASRSDDTGGDAPGEAVAIEAADDAAERAVVTADVESDASPYKEDDTATATPATARAPRVRHTIYTARYRLVIKGADRGKWEADVVAEAEAPLITVETVVRGVQRRAGEDSAITRFSAAQVAHALRLAPADPAAQSKRT